MPPNDMRTVQFSGAVSTEAFCGHSMYSLQCTSCRAWCCDSARRAAVTLSEYQTNPSCRVISFRRAAEGTRSGQRRWEDVHVVGISISVFDVHPFSIVSGHSSLWQKTAQQGETSHPFRQGWVTQSWTTAHR